MVLNVLQMAFLAIILPIIAGLRLLGFSAVWLSELNPGAEKRQRQREEDRIEQERELECHQVVLEFANELGYIARQTITRDELSDLIDSGIQPADLVDTIWEGIDQQPGLVLGHHEFSENSIPVVLAAPLRSRHVYAIGKSGFGKTTLIRNMAIQDLEQGNGFAVIAPEQELITEEILPFVPEHRFQDIIYINPADTERPVPFNPLELFPGEDLDLKVDQTFTVFRRVFGEARTPRMDTIVRNGLHLLISIPDTTLLDFERLLSRHDDSFRRWATAKATDDQIKRFWSETYESYPQDAHLPLFNRLNQLLQPKVIRNLLCSKGKSLRLRQAMDSGKVLLFNLSDGVLGEANAQVLGQLVVANLQLAVMSRADIPPDERRPFYLYIDEFQTFCGTVGTSYEKMLSRARKYGLGLVLAHQQSGQISDSLLKEIFGNVSTMISFLVSAGDAHRLAREFVGEKNGVPTPAEPLDFLALRQGQAVAKIQQSTFQMMTLPPPGNPNYQHRDQIIDLSRSTFGVSLDCDGPGSISKKSDPKPPPDSSSTLDDLDPDKVF